MIFARQFSYEEKPLSHIILNSTLNVEPKGVCPSELKNCRLLKLVCQAFQFICHRVSGRCSCEQNVNWQKLSNREVWEVQEADCRDSLRNFQSRKHDPWRWEHHSLTTSAWAKSCSSLKIGIIGAYLREKKGNSWISHASHEKCLVEIDDRSSCGVMHTMPGTYSNG